MEQSGFCSSAGPQRLFPAGRGDQGREDRQDGGGVRLFLSQQAGKRALHDAEARAGDLGGRGEVELVRFGEAMANGELLDSATVNLFWTPQRLKSGAPTTYGYGWAIQNVPLGDDEQATTKMIGHGGSVLGGQASLMIFPEEDMIVAVMTNASADVSDFAREIAGFFRDSR